jgi:D-beta-D-heptose 7-phosphate kinase/D-beta-D-heptose 1-phosphate adenosyltransferase
MQSIKHFLECNKNNIIVGVVGDSIIDEYFNIKVTRISPEFPTQIMHSNTVIPAAKVPGGAANVCTQMSKFNVDCYLISFKENEDFADQKFNSEYSYKIPGKIPLKRRFYDGDYPLPRWDIEQENYGLSPEELEHCQSQLFKKFEKFVKDKKPDIVVLSDYGKGLFVNYFSRKIIKLCNNNNIPTVVDPKNPPFNQWSGCTYFKPNAFEACKMTDIKHPVDHDWISHAREFINVDMKNIIITDGPNPPFVFNGKIVSNDIKLAREPEKNSVIGAGDCFCAFLTMCLAHKMNLRDSVEVAWNSSSLYIESKHNKPIMPYEFTRWSDPIHSKIISVDEMENIMKYDKATWVWTNGCFDFAIHIGHLKTLEIAKKSGDRVIVGVNTDQSVKRLKGESRPILTWKQRAENLAHLQYVDFIVPIDEDTPKEIIKLLKPSIIIKGEEYKDKYIAGSEYIDEWGGKIILVPMIKDISTTKMIEKIKT